MSEEQERLHGADWKRWGPYLSERAWGTVREDYSPDGTAWESFPHEHARARAYRWNEDGLAGISDDQQRLCFALACWNGRDPILKERLFGLTGNEGNHGEDVKEQYFYLDATPTHSWLRMLYKYPQAAFPYVDLVQTNRRRGRLAPEYELIDTGAFADNRYFDIFVTYAQARPADMLVEIRAVNCGPDPALLHLLPTIWFRNTWSWGHAQAERPRLYALDDRTILAEHPSLGRYRLACADGGRLLFTENETNTELLFGYPNRTPYVKDAFHRYFIGGEAAAVNPARTGTKATACYQRSLAPAEEWVVQLRLTRIEHENLSSEQVRLTDFLNSSFSTLNLLLAQREAEADAFYAELQPPQLSDDERLVQRQALAGMIWGKQFYYFDVDQWLTGDPAQPAPPPERKKGRNRVYEDIATKFFEHFLYIAQAMNNIAGQGVALWDAEDQFFYDVLHIPHQDVAFPLKIRSMVGLIPLFAVMTIEPELLARVPDFRGRLEWFLNNRPDLAKLISRWDEPGLGERRLLALCRGSRMKRVLKRMLDEGEFLSGYGVRALSRYHADQPYTLEVAGVRYEVGYQPAESDSGLFGGNSNWRGPIWFPVNYLLIESLQQYYHYYGDEFRVECPTGSGHYLSLDQIADLLSQRLMAIFLRDGAGRRAVFGGSEQLQSDPLWRDYIPFYEYFHGDNGAGIGASHQTGWTGLVAKLIQQQGAKRGQ